MSDETALWTSFIVMICINVVIVWEWTKVTEPTDTIQSWDSVSYVCVYPLVTDSVISILWNLFLNAQPISLFKNVLSSLQEASSLHLFSDLSMVPPFLFGLTFHITVYLEARSSWSGHPIRGRILFIFRMYRPPPPPSLSLVRDSSGSFLFASCA